MKLLATLIGLISAFLVLGSSWAGAQEKKIAIVYFTWSGNTRLIAKLIHEKVGGDLIEIQVVKPYPTDYDVCVAQARDEQRDGVKPALKDPPSSLAQYDTIILGFPNWWSSYPRPIATLLDTVDLSGKTVINFVTHNGSRLGRVTEDLAKALPKSTFLEPLAIRQDGGSSLSKDIDAWLAKIGLKK
ncbi:MAG: NAD(P)H-dependent oxidoreductase [Deltaproteobacteria bacterium]|nr:NAD(P)H-dependent oxidoreductase [Deltaproteobacteria bacterium]